MPEPMDIKALELRVIELENQLKAVQPMAGNVSDSDLQVYWNLISKWKPPYRCIFECGPCGPCMCDPILVGRSLINQARLAQVAGVLKRDTVEQLTKQVNEAIKAR